jgi:hypothetical protein
MSMWGMNDGAALTGAAKFTNDAATFIDGTSGSNTTFVTDGLQAGDVVVGADGLLYRIIAVASETAATLDRVYEGSTANNQTVQRIKLPRHIKITNDDGTGHTLASLGIFGFSGAEAMAGGDDVVSMSNQNNTYSGVVVADTQGGAGYTSAPTVTVTQPTAHTFDATSTSVVVAATDAIVPGGTLPATGTNLRYYNFPGGSYSAKSGTASGAVPAGDLANNDVVYARTANSTAIYLYNSFANATANNGIGQPSTGLQSITGVSGTAGNHTLVGQTAAATAVIASGRVSSYTITTSGSGYASAPTLSVATQDALFNAESGVTSNGMITTTAVHGLVVGDRVQYDRNSRTAIAELTDTSYYYVVTLGSTTTLQLGATRGGAIIALSDGSDHNQKLIGEAATATAALGVGRAGSGGGRQRDMMGAHLGWVKRTVGTGGRAGRVHYESLVAASSITGDGEDLATPDE